VEALEEIEEVKSFANVAESAEALEEIEEVKHFPLKVVENLVTKEEKVKILHALIAEIQEKALRRVERMKDFLLL
jgi:hypothetical protein